MAIRKYNTYSSAEIDIFHQIVTKLGEEIKKEPNKVTPKIGFFGKIKRLFS